MHQTIHQLNHRLSATAAGSMLFRPIISVTGRPLVRSFTSTAVQLMARRPIPMPPTVSAAVAAKPAKAVAAPSTTPATTAAAAASIAATAAAAVAVAATGQSDSKQRTWQSLKLIAHLKTTVAFEKGGGGGREWKHQPSLRRVPNHNGASGVMTIGVFDGDTMIGTIDEPTGKVLAPLMDRQLLYIDMAADQTMPDDSDDADGSNSGGGGVWRVKLGLWGVRGGSDAMRTLQTSGLSLIAVTERSGNYHRSTPEQQRSLSAAIDPIGATAKALHPHGSSPKCGCKLDAVMRVVKKVGPNTGRQFWGCANRKCDFFAWTDSHNPNLHSDHSNVTTAVAAPKPMGRPATAVPLQQLKQNPPVGRVRHLHS